MISKINDSVDPCEDFFEFACGNYKPNISGDKTLIHEFSLSQDLIQMQLNRILKSPIKLDEVEPFQKAKMFYKNCVDTGLHIKNLLTASRMTFNETFPLLAMNISSRHN